MSGFVTKRNIYHVFRSFGIIMAVKLLISRDKTFLNFLTRLGIFS